MKQTITLMLVRVIFIHIWSKFFATLAKNGYVCCLSNSYFTIGELENSKLWLSKFQEPWDLVVEKWKSTFPLRKSDNKSTTVNQYIGDWPILKHREAYSLVCKINYVHYVWIYNLIYIFLDGQWLQRFISNMYNFRAYATGPMEPVFSKI